MKTLILLCDQYPNKKGEFFLDDELKVISRYFQKILILSVNDGVAETNRSIPENAELQNINVFLTNKEKIFGIFGVLIKFGLLLKEFQTIINTYKLNLNLRLIKIALVDFLKAKKVQNKIKTLIKNRNLSKDQVVIYSYWHDYKALAGSFLAREGFFSIARCHRWDVYLYSQDPTYLPFKPFILVNLNSSISISDDGKKYINEIFNNKYSDKIKVSKLGKYNRHLPNETTMKGNEIHIVSCSTLTSVKRVEKIIEVLKILNHNYKTTVKWSHFGDGPLREKLEIKAKNDLSNYNFFGVQPNDYLLDFYNENYIDLFINLSDSEGIPVSIMEAQSAGIPVLATAVGGTPEIVNKENGILVDKDELNEEIAQKIIDYLNLPEVEKQKKRELSYQNWKENYNAETNYTKFIQTILDPNP